MTRLLALPYHPRHVFTTDLQTLNVASLKAWYLVLYGNKTPTGLKRADCLETLVTTIKKLQKSFSSPIDQITSDQIKKLKKTQLRNWSKVFSSESATAESILQSISEWGIELNDESDPEIPVAEVLNDNPEIPIAEVLNDPLDHPVNPMGNPLLPQLPLSARSQLSMIHQWLHQQLSPMN